MLEIIDGSFYYEKDMYIFKDVSLSIKKGEVVGMFGESGLGKTTLAKVLANYLPLITGEVLINKKQIIPNKYYPIQLIWQHPERAINPKWRLKKIYNEIEHIDDEIFQLLSIQKDWLNRFPHELSGGELQRFSIARALGDETKYIIADEITSMFDAVTQAQIWYGLLQLIKKRKIGMLVISHDLFLLERICDRIINFNEMI